MADMLKTPGELANLGKASANYFDKINRQLAALGSADPVTVPIGAGVRRFTVIGSDSANYTLDSGGVPAGFLRCTAQVVSRTDYPDLFTAYGVPVGVDTMTLPNDNTQFIRVL